MQGLLLLHLRFKVVAQLDSLNVLDTIVALSRVLVDVLTGGDPGQERDFFLNCCGIAAT